jgi:SOUL heme-binding protein
MLVTFVCALLFFVCFCSSSSTTPWYYHGLDGPVFKTVEVDGEIQVREYGSYFWASTAVEETNLNVAENIGFQRLFDYISGENELGIAIDMTTPVLTRVVPGTHTHAHIYTHMYTMYTHNSGFFLYCSTQVLGRTATRPSLCLFSFRSSIRRQVLHRPPPRTSSYSRSGRCLWL